MVHDLLRDLNRLGIRLRLVKGRLDVLAPAGSLTPEVRERLTSHRDRLVALLRRAEVRADQTEITPRPDQRYEPFPLTDIQHAYWVGRNPAMELGGVCTHYYFELERDGLDPRRLTESLRRVIERHDMLRAVIQPDGQQRVLPEVPAYEIVVNDLRDLTPEGRAAECARIRAEMAHQAPPPERWPLFEVRLSRFDDRRIRMHVSVNLLIVDAFSLDLLFKDWRRFYEEPDWSPHPLPLEYRDYVMASMSLRDGSRYRAAEEYWLGRLDSLPPAPALPLAKQPAQLSRTVFTGRAGRLDGQRWDFVKRLARGHGLTPSAVLMTAFADVLRIWSRQPSFTLNVTLFDRPPAHPRIGEIIGDFTSLTMLAVEAGPDESFTTRAARLQQRLMRDLEHASYSGVRVLRERARRLGGGPDAAMPVVFTSALALTSHHEPHRGRGFFGDLICSISQTPQVWLDHQVAEERGDLVFNWDAVEALFPEGLLDDMFAAYRALLDRLSRDEDAWTSSDPSVALPPWQTEERVRANDTATAIPARTLVELVEAAAKQRPDAVAVIAHDGSLTYREVVRTARRLARRLVALGAAAGGLVGVVMDKGWEQVPAVLGVAQSGAAWLPVDPRWPDARRRQVLEFGGVGIVVTSPRYRDELAWPPGVDVVTFADAEVRAAASGQLDGGPTPADLAYVIFTSGSTGQPKGVMIDHRGAANTVQDMNHRFRVGPHDRVLALSELSFDLSVYDIFGLLAAGGTVVMPAPDATRDAARWTELMDRHGVTIWNSVPALMQAWVDARGSANHVPAANHAPAANHVPAANHAPAAKLRLILLSGDWIPVSLPAAVRAGCPDAELISLGGATEASIWSVHHRIDQVAQEWTSIPYGKPLANQTLHVYDERLESCPVWTTGELYIGGTGVAKGYWADPERTAERFVSHPKTHERLYRTGDLGRYLPGGDIEFLGREDFQVKLNGYRIELGEIGAALRRQPDVAEALVDVVPSPRNGRRQLVAYVVPARAADGRDCAGTASWSALVEAGTAELRQGAADLSTELATFEGWWRVMDGICPSIMARTLARIGAFTAAGDTATAADIVQQRAIKPQYAGLVDQWLSALGDEGLLRPTGQAGEYRAARGLDADRLDAAVRRQLATIDVGGVDRVFLDYLRGCADSHIGLLRGEVSPLELLMPRGGWQVTDALYAGNPVSHLLNRVAARVVRTFVERLPAGRPVRILEVGAGTGATSVQILRGLPAERVSYRFTDLSTFFTEHARRTFAAHRFLEYGVYDIDRKPAAQGVAPGSVDVVVAANVLHNARDLAQTMAYLRSVLAPGGILACIEGTTNSRIQMISVGFLEGFGHHRGQRELPLLSVPRWRETLAAAGFTRFASIPDGDAVAAAMIQHVLVGGVPDVGWGTDPAGLRQALDGLLPDYMVPKHYVLIDRLPLSANGKLDRSALPAPWSAAARAAPAAPRDAIEIRLLGIWREVLQRDDFGVEDNFFELGGDSMHVVRLLGLVRDELGVSLIGDEGLQALFDSPTVAGLAGTLRGLGSRP